MNAWQIAVETAVGAVVLIAVGVGSSPLLGGRRRGGGGQRRHEAAPEPWTPTPDPEPEVEGDWDAALVALVESEGKR